MGYSELCCNKISVDEAKQIALKHAKLTSDKVTFIKVEFDAEDGKYEIEFSYNSKEYDYEINAYTGKLISYEID